MTCQEQALHDEKMRAEIAKLQGEAAILFNDAVRRSREPDPVDERERAELRKLVAEAGQLCVSMFLAPFLAAAALMGATAAVIKIFFP